MFGRFERELLEDGAYDVIPALKEEASCQGGGIMEKCFAGRRRTQRRFDLPFCSFGCKKQEKARVRRQAGAGPLWDRERHYLQGADAE